MVLRGPKARLAFAFMSHHPSTPNLLNVLVSQSADPKPAACGFRAYAGGGSRSGGSNANQCKSAWRGPGQTVPDRLFSDST